MNLPASHILLHSCQLELYSQSGPLLLLPETQNTKFSLSQIYAKFVNMGCPKQLIKP